MPVGPTKQLAEKAKARGTDGGKTWTAPVFVADQPGGKLRYDYCSSTDRVRFGSLRGCGSMKRISSPRPSINSQSPDQADIGPVNDLSNREKDERLLWQSPNCLLEMSHSGSGEKGTDVALAIDALQVGLEGKIDIAVLVTGDADFVPLVHALMHQGVRVMAAHFNYVNGEQKGYINERLLNVCNYSLDINGLQSDRQREAIFKGLFRKANEFHDNGATGASQTSSGNGSEPSRKTSPTRSTFQHPEFPVTSHDRVNTRTT